MKIKERVQAVPAKVKAFGFSVFCGMLTTPTTAMAAGGVDPGEMLGNGSEILKSGIQFLGAILIVFGLVNLGMTIKDGMQGGGGQLAGAIAMIVGGAVVVAAAVYFGSLDTTWAS